MIPVKNDRLGIKGHTLKVIKVLIVSLLSLSAYAYADPAPFGLIINKTTIDELKSAYSVHSLGFNKNSGLEAYDLDPPDLKFEGLLSAKAAFSNDHILKLVQLSLPQSKFEEIYNSLKNKYKFVYKNTPFGGNKEAKFEQDNTYIVLYSAQGSEEMDILYINKTLLEEAINPPASDKVVHQEVSRL